MASTENSGPDNVVVIKVVGTGGAGNNAIDRMIENDIRGVEYIAINTDKPALSKSRADIQLQIGAKITKGQGAGSEPEVGKRAAEENRSEIAKLLEDTHMVFIACGMGGGTGTGSAPVIAEIAREMGLLTVGIVTKPFKFEGARRMRQAEDGINNLISKVDALFVIPNERLKTISSEKITMINAFKIADNVLCEAVRAVTELVTDTDMINLDFADITTTMRESGYAHMGVGRASGKNKAEEAAKIAIASDLMETSIKDAKSIIVHVMGSADLALEEVETAGDMIRAEVHPTANIIYGQGIDDDMGDEMRVTIIATRFDELPASMRPQEPEIKVETAIEKLRAVQQPAEPQPEPEPEPPPAPTTPPPSAQTRPQFSPEPQDDDDMFDELINIFKK